MKPDSQGARAMAGGEVVHDLVVAQLNAKGYLFNDARTRAAFEEAKGSLFAASGQYAMACRLPLRAPWHGDADLSTRADFLIRNRQNNLIAMTIKEQESDGTAEKQLEFKIMNLVDTLLPVAVLVHGPMKGRDGLTGFTPEVLVPIWHRVRHYGRLRVYLFRSEDRLGRWIADGLPVSRAPADYDSLFATYCDGEP